MSGVVRALLAIAIVALVLVGCGGGSSSTSTLSSSSASGSPGPAAAPPEAAQEPKPKDEQNAAASKPKSQGALTDPGPLPNQGTEVVAPGVPTAKGGDNSIQRYGLEADSRERQQVASIAKGYLDAQAAGRWAEACADLFFPIRKNLEKLASSAQPLAGKGCAGAMAAIVGKRPSAERQEAADIHVLSLRVNGTQAFVIYRDGAGRPSNLPLVRDGGEWKVSALAGIGLVL